MVGRGAALALAVLAAAAAVANAQGPPPSQGAPPSGGASPGFANVTVQSRRENMTTSLKVENKAGVPVRLMGCPGPVVQPGQTITVPVAGLSRFWVVPADAKVDCHTGPFDGLFYFSADLLSEQPVVTIGYTNKTGPEASAAGNESKIATVQLSSSGTQGGAGGQPAAQGQQPSAPAPGAGAQGQQQQQQSSRPAPGAAAQGQQPSTPAPGAPTQLQQGQEPSTPAPGETAQGQQPSTPTPGAQAQGQQPSTPPPGPQAQGQQPSTPPTGPKAQGQQSSTPAPGAGSQGEQQQQGEQGLRSPVTCRVGGCDAGSNVTSLPSELTFTIMSAQPSLFRRRHGYGR